MAKTLMPKFCTVLMYSVVTMVTLVVDIAFSATVTVEAEVAGRPNSLTVGITCRHALGKGVGNVTTLSRKPPG